jgi:hypothetical protein
MTLDRHAPGSYTSRDGRFAVTRFAQVTGGVAWWWFDRRTGLYGSRPTLAGVRRALGAIAREGG